MRSPECVRRLITLLLGCWFTVYAADPAALRVCPVHDIAAPASHASHHTTQNPGQRCSCTCAGACCPGVGARLESPPLVATARIVIFVESAPAPAPVTSRPDARVVLPPPIGPPRLG